MTSREEKEKLKKAIYFIEELSWLIESEKDFDLDEIVDIISAQEKSSIDEKVHKRYLSHNRNKNILVGILPSFFQDQDLFPTNMDIVDFAERLLGIEVSRGDKRSRYEIIGLIVTRINDLDDKELYKIVDALSIVMENKFKLEKLKEDKKRNNFSWNTAIRNLSDRY